MFRGQPHPIARGLDLSIPINFEDTLLTPIYTAIKFCKTIRLDEREVFYIVDAHVFSRDFTVLPAHPHVHPQSE